MQGFSPKLPLSVDSVDGIYGMNKTALESIKQDLKMLILTNRGERIMLPDYGASIRSFLFQQNTDQLKNNISTSISYQISKYMNFISLRSIDITDDPINENSIKIRIEYSVPSLSSRQELNLSINSN